MDRECGPICLADHRATIDDPRPNARKDVDRKVSWIVITPRTLESSRTRREEAACWIFRSEHLIILRSPRSSSLGSPLVM